MRKMLIFICLAFIFSCSSEKPSGKTEAEVLYKEALEYVEDERFLLATERLNLLRSQYPYSYYATHAELLQADILYLQENYVEAAAAYGLFRDFHPKHEKLAYVIWRMAESFFNQLPDTFDRDLSPAYESIKLYQELINKFPKFEEVEQANKKISTCKTMLRKKDKYIADFYYKTEVFDAALFRYQYIINNHQDPDLIKHSKIRVVESALYAGNFEECIKFANLYKSDLPATNQKRLDKIGQTCSQKYKEKLANEANQ